MEALYALAAVVTIVSGITSVVNGYRENKRNRPRP